MLSMILLMGWLACPGHLYAQTSGSPIIQNYPPKTYHASSANYTAVQDARGLMYFGNYRGVLEYDGEAWTLIPLSNSSTARSLARDSMGQVFVGGVGVFGTLEPDEGGSLAFRNLLPDSLKRTHLTLGPTFVLGANRGAWFLMGEQGWLFHWDLDNLIQIPWGTEFGENHPFVYRGILMANHPDRGWVQWLDGEWRDVPGGDQMVGKVWMGIRNLSNGRVLGFCKSMGICEAYIDPQLGLIFKHIPTDLDNAFHRYGFTGIIPLRDGRIVVGTIKKGAVVLDRDGQVERKLNEHSGLQDNLVLGGMEDQNGSLWLTLSRGISRVETSSPLMHWGEPHGLKGIIFSVTRFQDRLYVSTPIGVYVQSGEEFVQVKGLDVESWTLVEVSPPGGRPQLLVTSMAGIFEIRNQQAIPILPDVDYAALYASPHHPDRVYGLSWAHGVDIITWNGKKWGEPKPIQGLDRRFQGIIEDEEGYLWMVEMLANRRLIRLDLSAEAHPEWTVFDSTAGLPPVTGVYDFAGSLLIGTERGLYRFDSEAGEFYPDQVLGTYDPAGIVQVSRFVEDSLGNVWMERKSPDRQWVELLRKEPDGTFRHDASALAGLSDIEIWGNLYPESDGKTWICTLDGLYGLDTRLEIEEPPILDPIIRSVVLGLDSVLFSGALDIQPDSQAKNSWTLTHTDNNLTFSFAAPYFEDESGTRYSYLLSGKDVEWSPWGYGYQKEYNGLDPGEYVFKVRARDAMNRESQAVEFAFSIQKPWYKTSWAFVCYGLLAILLIYGTVKLNTQRLHLQNEHLERIVFERTQELWEQHKEIVKKTVKLKRQKEEISKQHDLVEEKNQKLESIVDQLKNTQSQLVNSEKMASLGQLTAGIAHEINNPINYVKGNISPLKRDYVELREMFEQMVGLDPDDPELPRHIQKIRAYADEIDAPYLFVEMEQLLKGIEEGANRTKVIVDELKTFSRLDEDNFKLVDIHQGLDSTLTLLSTLIRDRIEIHRIYGELPMVECLPGKLNQVFMNMISNAVHAIEARHKKEGGGHHGFLGDIYITTRHTRNEDPECPDCVQISIRDNGTGIDKKVCDKIFEPFFTTKEVGKGTGLGLSISFGIVERHHGKIDVHSEPGQGTEFVITLPFKQDIPETVGEMAS
ncbi:ATP-binding protein [Pontibacter sp. G13]|uniref:ATP-binding protein n=1 Tax=Pontibacter sp. G13 TaxID=3074898 RepID=UPI00288B3BCD|nr:ATP-binding protein [Pontibacter sp. G13]WNJ20837.1 ATP-binding protein [Pontibacter sp. G13]